jgi:gliding motility-associated-like protein
VKSSNFIWIILLCQITAFSQNLVPNCDFEYYSSCPNNTGELEKAWDWHAAGEGTSDYCNACGSSVVNVPNNLWGVEAAISGAGYGHIICYYPHMGYDYREYMQVKLLSTLLAGGQYDVSFYVSCSDKSCWAIDGLGLLFSVDPIEQVSSFVIDSLGPGDICNPPGSIITNLVGWKQISGQFIAMGGERYITIGNFIPESELTINPIYGSTEYYTSFYIDLVSVIGPTLEPIDILQNDTTICYGESILVAPFVCGGGTYTWGDGFTGPYRVITQPGTYTLFVNVGDTVISDQITVSWWPELNLDILQDTVTCHGALVWLEPGAFSSYLWQDGSTDDRYLANQEGTYWVEITDEHGCNFRDTSVISWLPIQAVDLIPDTLVCNGAAVVLDPGDYSSCHWQDGSTGGNYLAWQPGKYWVDFTDNNGCLFTDTSVVSWLPVPVVDLLHDTILCHGTSILLNPGDYSSYQWQDWSTGESYLADQAGNYWVEFAAEGGCRFRDTLVISWQESLVDELSGDRTLCIGDTIVLDAGNEDKNADYLWQNNSTDKYLAVSDDGMYSVTVTNPCGSITESVLADFIDCNLLVIVPNAFSPNGDGNNDIFMPSCYLTSVYHLQIFNRWGELIFTSDNPGTGWDGTKNSKTCPADVYVWLVYYESDATERLIKKMVRGNVLLIR